MFIKHVLMLYRCVISSAINKNKRFQIIWLSSTLVNFDIQVCTVDQ